MVLTNENPLTRRERELFIALKRANGAWMRRGTLAKVGSETPKKRLSPQDIQVLDGLVERGLVEIRRLDDPTPIGYVHEYRAKE